MVAAFLLATPAQRSSCEFGQRREESRIAHPVWQREIPEAPNAHRECSGDGRSPRRRPETPPNAPTPRESTTVAPHVKAGAFRKDRTPYAKSCHIVGARSRTIFTGFFPQQSHIPETRTLFQVHHFPMRLLHFLGKVRQHTPQVEREAELPIGLSNETQQSGH
jgi:hypothetical protein